MARQNKETRNNQEQVQITSLRVMRASEYKDTTFLDLEVNGVKIYGCRFINGKNGNFVAFPSQKGKDGQYYNIAYVPLTDEHVNQIDEQLDELL